MMFRVVAVLLLSCAAFCGAVRSTSSNSVLRVFGAQPVSEGINTSAEMLKAHLVNLNATVTAAAQNGADIVVFPELYYQGYSFNAVGFAIKSSGDPALQFVSSVAKANGVGIVFPYAEADGDVLYDALDVFDETGAVILHYRKVNLAAGENAFFKPGNFIGPVVTFKGIQLGVLICFDVFLPEASRLLALQGAQMILIPTANGYPAGQDAIGNILVPARAIENGVYTAYINWVQVGPSVPSVLTFHGQSVMSDTGGTLVAAAPPDVAALIHADFNFTGVVPYPYVTPRPVPDLVPALCNATAPGL